MNAVVSQSAAQANMPVTDEGNAAFNLVYRRAKAMAASTLIPKEYRDNIPNVMIALELAQRIGAAPMQIMQNLHIIQGRPSLSSSFLIATVNACGRFTPLRFEIVGTDPAAKDFRVRAYAEDKASKERCDGTWITWKMVDAEGWSKKPGSKWMTMPEQMFRYRAAAFWARVYAPEVSQGIHTEEEVTDVWATAQVVPERTTNHGNLRQLEATLSGRTLDAEDVDTNVIDDNPLTAQEVHDAITAAEDIDTLDAAADLIRMLPDDEHRGLVELYERRRNELDQLP